MSEEIKIIIPGKPCARKAHKIVKVGKFSKPVLDDDSASFQNLCAMAAQKAMGSRPPLQGHVAAQYLFVFPAPKSLPKKDRIRIESGELLLHNTRQDADNLMKNVNDGIKGIAIQDDNLIRSWMGDTRIGLTPCTIVVITQIEYMEAISILEYAREMLK
jgi:Holliday junction resolvase RusA-like endonuclease